jgi:dolichyl-phosphate-mannose-protein mannosyltransferase
VSEAVGRYGRRPSGSLPLRGRRAAVALTRIQAMNIVDSTAGLKRPQGGLSLPSLRRLAARSSAWGPPLVVVAAVAAFVAISVWWVLTDARLPDGDNGKHLNIAFGYYDVIRAGHPQWVLSQFNFYPPLIHLVGALGSLIAGPSQPTAVITENLVFVPMLAFGCYGTATHAFGRQAGVLAALFALGAPFVLGLFHVFMLDAPTTAIVSVTVWALLAAERFSRTGMSAVAGVLAGAGMYAKSTFGIFIGGVVLVMLLRGGWRNWRGLLAFAGIAVALAFPWYFYHRDILFGQTEGAVSTQKLLWIGNTPYPSRFSLDNFTWYWWNLVNNQLYLPLTLFFLTGVGYFGWRWVRRRRPDAAVPELMAGAIVSYLGISMITLDDPRYTLPMLVYLAVLGTGWITRTRLPIRVAATALLAGVLVFNTINLDWGKPGWLAVIRLPRAMDDPIGRNKLTVVSPAGYPAGRPDSRGAKQVRQLLERAHAAGARRVVFDAASLNTGGFNLFGLAVFARGAGLKVLGFSGPQVVKPTDIFVWRQLATQVHSEPCVFNHQVRDGTAFFVRWGSADPPAPTRCPR